MGYVTHPLTYLIGKPLVKVDTYSLVNLIHGDRLIGEYIQKDFTVKNVRTKLEEILLNGDARETVLEGYRKMKDVLGSGSASERAATAMRQYLTESVS